MNLTRTAARSNRGPRLHPPRRQGRAGPTLKIAVFLNSLGLGGTEKAASRWARGLHERGHAVRVHTLADGPRRTELEAAGIDVQVLESNPAAIASALCEWTPEILHTHAPGNPHPGDVLGAALALLPGKIPVVQTNIFGRFNNPQEDHWTNVICSSLGRVVSRRPPHSYHRLDAAFFQRASVAVYPLDADDGPTGGEAAAFRTTHGVAADEVLFGRLSRPDPAKWIDLPLTAFRRAASRHPKLKLLLREPPPAIARQIEAAPDRERFLLLPATGDPAELRRTIAALDSVLHTSIIGESFGYGIAEPMNLGKSVIAHSVPWQDQAQIELVRHGECGYIASTPASMTAAILRLADDARLRARLGRRAQEHIRQVADPETSLDRLEGALAAVIAGGENPRAAEDLAQARTAAAYLDTQQFGHSAAEQWALRTLHYRVRFHDWRRTFQARLDRFAGVR